MFDPKVYFSIGDRSYGKGVQMDNCEHCGAPLDKSQGPIPEIGTTGGGQTLTDLPRAGTKDARKELHTEIHEHHEHEMLIEGASGDPCPHCGMSGGGQTLTDLPKVNLREAHRKLKAEIKEARDKERGL
jgi:hypothetical protein